jgi:very-short-patch-repair endonuclease
LDITLLEFAKSLRSNSTKAENYLWLFLRNKQCEGFKFRRQQPIGRYFADFVSCERQLIIEVDGGQHNTYSEKDKARDEWFRKEGYEVLRFWNNEVFKNKDEVLEIIRQKLLSPHLNPLPQGERKSGTKEI